MSFDADAGAYQRFMGRYSEPLAREFLVLLDPHPGQRALDVGAGTGALTAPLVEALGAHAVAAIDPSESFVGILRSRFPGVDVHRGVAERLPFDDGAFDIAAAQLVVHFMSDPVAGLSEMARVSAPGGVVAASAWDLQGGRAPLSLIYRGAQDIDPDVDDESDRPGAGEGRLAELFAEAGIRDLRDLTLTVSVPYRDFDEWWQPFTLNIGPVGEYVASLEPDHREALRARCSELLPPGPGELDVTAWVVIGRA